MPEKRLSFDEMHKWLKPRAKDAHKGSFGHVLVIGSDYGMPGAGILAAQSAARMGAGLVTVVTRPEHITAVVSRQPELLCYGLKKTETTLLNTALTKATVIVLGPGLGQSTWSEWLFDTTIQHIKTHKTPCLIDADGLNWLARKGGAPLPMCIFTPHPGEAARLLNTTTTNIQVDRKKAILSLYKKLHGTIVLKGHHSLLYTASEPMYVCDAGNPAMASGGMGDLLSGMIAGLITQDLTAWQATQMAVLLHAAAGDKAFQNIGGPGLLASDVLHELKPLINASGLL
ncbi:MAG: NAD(P)H-hydrate dehydratase [Legionellaceae bacterium]|nr:NAD(P)H-hydrate dehydratase [Legionellaceae bacterium]